MRKRGVFKMGIMRLAAMSPRWLLIALVLLLNPLARDGMAEDSVCARVKIEVQQELTLERQAFDAHMRINNGLEKISLENVNVEVTFADERGSIVRATSDPNDSRALFFFGLNSMENIDRVDGNGTVAPASSADIHWLIIPAPGASKGVEAGTLYYVGATLTYTMGGEGHTTTVTPDHIFVKPMPEMTLDYFLPGDVYGDDAFTPQIEAPVPFPLGVRVMNSGTGVAKNLKIDSAQPKIMDNAQGLLVGFAIQGCEVNGREAQKTLLADLGDILPHTSAVARWIMTCSLSGKFVDFKAELSHGDELGGEVTSLIDTVNTHLLVRDVLVDLPGRDGIKDFLAKDGGIFRVYESESLDSVVLNQSGSASMQLTGNVGSEISYALSIPVTAGFMYVQFPDPSGGQKTLKQVIRSDGKRIKPENAWISKTRGSSETWQHFINLFDVNGTNSYTVVFDDPAFVSQPPVLQFIPDRVGVEGRPLSFSVSAIDPDGTIPGISAVPLPALARFIDLGNGTGAFEWTPASGQAGRYDVTFTASDGLLKATQRAVLNICPAADSDCDGMPDEWEMRYFGTLARDGKGDFNGNGVTDLDEYLRRSDPTAANGPSVPIIESPRDGTEVAAFQPDLIIRNSTSPGKARMTYEFELYSDQQLSQLVERAMVPEGLNTTICKFSQNLSENTKYTFRVRATDGMAYSKWAYSSFLVNTENEPPGAFNISSPLDHSQVSTWSPVLQVTNSVDLDGDGITYNFKVYGSDMTTLIVSSPDLSPGEGGSTSWQVHPGFMEDTWYFWQAVATDEHGESTATPIGSFFVNTTNEAPEAPTLSSPEIQSEIGVRELDLVVNNAFDSDQDRLTYFFECDQMNTFDSDGKRVSGPVPEGEKTTKWHLSGLEDHTEYFWRAKASDGAAESQWVEGNFFVDIVNEKPTAPTLKNPGEGAWVVALTPTLELNPSLDVDRDRLNYRFEVYSNQSLSGLLYRGEASIPAWVVSSELEDHKRYFWRARAEDEHGTASDWMEISSFFVDNNGVDDPPDITMQEPSHDLVTNGSNVSVRWVDTDPENDAHVDLYYARDPSAAGGVLIKGGIEQSVNGTGGSEVWDVSSLTDGVYYVYATIMDRNHSKTSHAPGSITIDRTPPDVEAFPRGGTYQSFQRVTISSNEPSAIYYTLDGSDPTGDSAKYDQPIEIVRTTKLKFLAVDRAGNRSPVVAETYTMEAGWEVARFQIKAPARVQSELPFTIALRSLDRNGSLVEGFAGPLSLSVSSGVITPNETGQFRSGSWQGEVTITGTEGYVTIAAEWNGIHGTSGSVWVSCDPPVVPKLVRPRDGATDFDENTPFSWLASPGTTSYVLQISKDPQFGPIDFEDWGIAATQYKLPNEISHGRLEAGVIYYWRVRGVNHCGEGPFSSPRRFAMNEITSIRPIAPSEGEIIRGGQDYGVKWDYTGNPHGAISISYKIGGGDWHAISRDIPVGSGAFQWKVPPIMTQRCKIRVEAQRKPNIRAESGLFAIR